MKIYFIVLQSVPNRYACYVLMTHNIILMTNSFISAIERRQVIVVCVYTSDQINVINENDYSQFFFF